MKTIIYITHPGLSTFLSHYVLTFKILKRKLTVVMQATLRYTYKLK